MWKVSVENSVQGRSFAARFETEALADAWIAEQEEKESWGRGERWLSFDSVDEDRNLVTGTPETGHTDSRTYEIPTSYIENPDNLGQEPPDMIVDTTVTATEYFYPKEWTVTKEDITAQVAIEDGIKNRKAKRDHGLECIDLISFMIESKSTTNAEDQSLVSSYSEIITHLQLGNLDNARELVNAVTPDGVLVTQSDKDALIAKIDEHGA